MQIDVPKPLTSKRSHKYGGRLFLRWLCQRSQSSRLKNGRRKRLQIV